MCSSRFAEALPGFPREPAQAEQNAKGLDQGQGSTLGQALFKEFFVAEPKIRDIGGAETENILERATDFAKTKVHANLFEQINQRLSTFGQHRLGPYTGACNLMIGNDVEGVEARAVTHNVQEA